MINLQLTVGTNHFLPFAFIAIQGQQCSGNAEEEVFI